MEKMLLKNNNDLKNAIIIFGIEWEKEITEEIKIFPCILVSFYANDIEFGEIYRFTAVEISDFRQSIMK
tara:strand:- start:225 stop:431 length:207 start_codon:yes stop_codon:yes gene_type:complete